MEAQLGNLSLHEEEEGLEFGELNDVAACEDYSLCLVGTFVTNKSFNFGIMRQRMAEIWSPGRGVEIEDLGGRLILFRFFHEIDLRWVIEGGPWTHDGKLLVTHELKLGEDPTQIPLYNVAFWVKVYNLPPGFFLATVGRGLGDFIGGFVQYDEQNRYSPARPFMRIRAIMDIRQPLKREKKIRKAGSNWVTCTFKYEKLPTFCFICGRIGHVDRQCEVRYRVPEEEIVKLWDASLRAPPLRGGSKEGEKWLRSRETETNIPDAVERRGSGTPGKSSNPYKPRAAARAKTVQDLLVNFGANVHDSAKEVTYGVGPISAEQEGMEMMEDMKRRREETPRGGTNTRMEVEDTWESPTKKQAAEENSQKT